MGTRSVKDQPVLKPTGYYDRDGQIISADEWEELSSDKSYVVIGDDIVENGRVLTVWTGLDINPPPENVLDLLNLQNYEPIIFETHVMPDHKASYTQRHSALEKARRAHSWAVSTLENSNVTRKGKN